MGGDTVISDRAQDNKHRGMRGSIPSKTSLNWAKRWDWVDARGWAMVGSDVQFNTSLAGGRLGEGVREE